MDIVFSLIKKVLSYLWKNVRLVFFLSIIIIIEIFIAISWYGDKVREAQWANYSAILDYNITEKTQSTLKMNVTILNNREFGMSWTDLFLNCDGENILLLPVLEEPYGNEKLPISITPVIPSEEAYEITYEVLDYELYKERLEKAEKVILRTSMMERGGIPIAF